MRRTYNTQPSSWVRKVSISVTSLAIVVLTALGLFWLAKASEKTEVVPQASTLAAVPSPAAIMVVPNTVVPTVVPTVVASTVGVATKTSLDLKVCEKLRGEDCGLKLAQSVNIEKTVKGYTVRILRTYADANYLVVGFKVIGPDGKERNFNVQFSDIYLEGYEAATGIKQILRNGRDGQPVTSILGLGGQSGVEVAGIGKLNLAYFRLNHMPNLPKELKVILKLSNLEMDDTSKLGANMVTPATDSSAVHVNIDLVVPMQSSRVVELHQTVAVGDDKLTLQWVTVAPTGTYFQLAQEVSSTVFMQKQPNFVAGISSANVNVLGLTSFLAIAKNLKASDKEMLQGYADFELAEPVFCNSKEAWTITVKEVDCGKELCSRYMIDSGKGYGVLDTSKVKVGDKTWTFKFTMPEA